MKGTLLERLMAKARANRETGCWDWIGARTSTGYPQIWFEGKKLMGHRLSYLAHGGEIPEGWHLHHECRNPLCINPAHLTPLAPADHHRVDTSDTHCSHGHPRTPANTYWSGGRRACRDCRNEVQRRFQAKLRAVETETGRRPVRLNKYRLYWNPQTRSYCRLPDTLAGKSTDEQRAE